MLFSWPVSGNVITSQTQPLAPSPKIPSKPLNLNMTTHRLDHFHFWLLVSTIKIPYIYLLKPENSKLARLFLQHPIRYQRNPFYLLSDSNAARPLRPHGAGLTQGQTVGHASWLSSINCFPDEPMSPIRPIIYQFVDVTLKLGKVSKNAQYLQ